MGRMSHKGIAQGALPASALTEKKRCVVILNATFIVTFEAITQRFGVSNVAF